MATINTGVAKGIFVKPLSYGTLQETRAHCLKTVPGMTVYDDSVRTKFWSTVKYWEEHSDTAHLETSKGVVFLKGSYAQANGALFPVRYSLCTIDYNMICDIRIKPTLESRINVIKNLPMGLSTLRSGLEPDVAFELLRDAITLCAKSGLVVLLYGGSAELQHLGLEKLNPNIFGEMRNLDVLRYLQNQTSCKSSMEVIYDALANTTGIEHTDPPPFKPEVFFDCGDASSNLRCQMMAYIWRWMRGQNTGIDIIMQTNPHIRMQICIKTKCVWRNKLDCPPKDADLLVKYITRQKVNKAAQVQAIEDRNHPRQRRADPVQEAILMEAAIPVIVVQPSANEEMQEPFAQQAAVEQVQDEKESLGIPIPIMTEREVRDEMYHHERARADVAVLMANSFKSKKTIRRSSMRATASEICPLPAEPVVEEEEMNTEL